MTISRISFEINSENMFYLGKLADKYFIDALLRKSERKQQQTSTCGSSQSNTASRNSTITVLANAQ